MTARAYAYAGCAPQEHRYPGRAATAKGQESVSAIAEFLNAFEKSALMPDTKTAQWSERAFCAKILRRQILKVKCDIDEQ